MTDAIVVVVAVFGAQFLRYGFDNERLVIDSKKLFDIEIGYGITSAMFVLGWLITLSMFNTRDPKIIGSGSIEYRRVIDATVRIFGALAIVSLLFQVQFGRWYLLIALPSGLVLLLLSRWAWRQWLRRRRLAGSHLHHALVIGDREKASHVAEQIKREPDCGIMIIGAVTTHGSDDPIAGDVPVLGRFDEVLNILDRVDADTVILSTADAISPTQTRRFGWALDEKRIDLIVAPALTDIAGPRIHTRPVAGLPLIQVDYPAFSGRRRLTKRAFDLVTSAIALTLLSPLFVLFIFFIRKDGGPAFFAQERVGLNGKHFKMLKFRSMVADAEDLLPGLLDSSEGNGVLFKMKSDPRVTSLGRFLRRYSLDELPQLVNVLRGEMSLIGPRPPLAREVEHYEEHVFRRFLVRPGLTGLWQVSGRSNLSWDDSIRLDLYYVENWSLAGDFLILWKTVRAVVGSDGAY
ncbi:sugar transferase [Microbacterium sp. 69-10]|uniref:sugar transferase n=1 Tax=Microbacterium sp. 69-10 TaxID=1895783 RepID=UPI000A913844|nr:sugar transferase [Microbacterium sp. 69-10]